MQKNKLGELVDSGEFSIGTRVLSRWPTVIETIGQLGMFDYVEFAGEYVPYGLEDLDNMARAAELYDLSTMIKIDGSGREFLAQRALGSGFQNVLFADIRSREDAERCVQAVRAETPEAGGHNPCTMRRNFTPDKGGTTEFVEEMEAAVVALMIEKGSALEHLEEILSVDGVDMVQFGPCDYSMSIGMPGGMENEEVVEREKDMIELALANGVAPKVEISEPEEADRYKKLGVKHFSLNTDILILRDWLKDKGRELKNMLDRDDEGEH